MEKPYPPVLENEKIHALFTVPKKGKPPPFLTLSKN
jgi:hypothetical protein